ncbi:MAG: hypothetical protein NDI75_08665 [Candidatus Didemnitutus sp.]|jgi:hypothetical protein|nr:hypothetical protein [Candidatus Didemnitutus sp.]
MSERLQRARRLLLALDELAGQEAVLLRSLDLVEALRIAERAGPLVDEVCALAAEPDVAELRGEVQVLVERRRRNAALLDVHLARVQGEIQRVDEARRRLHRTAPAYQRSAGGDTPGESRLNTAA